MDHLTYKGSIPDAINAARARKKLFVVHISGQNEDSTSLEQSLWADNKVSEVIQKFCVFLHLIHGSVDASQFSAIFPQKSAPSISVIGLNGVLLWHHEGPINAASLAENIEKAWAALHLQETAATLLSVALASKQAGSVDLSNATAHGSFDATDVTSSPSGLTSQNAENNSKADHHTACNPNEDLSDEINTYLPLKDEPMAKEPATSGVSEIEIGREVNEKNPELLVGKDKEVLQDSTWNPATSETPVEDLRSESQANINKVESHAQESLEQTVNIGSNGRMSSETMVPAKQQKHPALAEVATSTIPKSNNIHISVRLLDGTNILMKLPKMDTLKSVKSFVDKNHATGVQSYNFAVPYPRRLFTDEDMSRTLSELGFSNREALIVVPIPSGGQSSSSSDANTVVDARQSNDENVGYFGFVKRILSFVNPLSYLGGSSTGQNSADGFRQDSSNPGFATTGSSGRALSSDGQHQASGNAGNARVASRPFGGNIHTLRQENDRFPSDRNTFWNGNSTQFGGDDKK